jgi:ribosomal protein L37AE/L43A
MVTPIEASAGKTLVGWIKNGADKLFKYGKRIATLEERVSALENALKTLPPEACPFCGERAMRLQEQSGLMGDPGKQWTEEIWRCEKCGKKYYEREKLKSR